MVNAGRENPENLAPAPRCCLLSHALHLCSHVQTHTTLRTPLSPARPRAAWRSGGTPRRPARTKDPASAAQRRARAASPEVDHGPRCWRWVFSAILINKQHRGAELKHRAEAASSPLPQHGELLLSHCLCAPSPQDPLPPLHSL